MSIIKAAGIDLAKLVISIHAVDANDKCKLRKTIKRNNQLAQVAKLPPCIIGMEAKLNDLNSEWSNWGS